MEISQYIRDLLFTHDRVILSDFGAFVAKYRPAKIDEKTNTMTPPGKDIVFDPTITKDGGLLRDHMMKHEGISSDDAEKQIMEYVKTVKSKLNAGKKVNFAELGSFIKLKNDKLFFTYEPGENLLTDSFGLKEVELPEEGSQQIAMAEAKIPEAKKEAGKSKKRYRGALIFIIIIAVIVLSGVAIYFLKPEWVTQGREYVTELFESNAESAENSGTDNNNTNNTDNTADNDSTAGDTDNTNTGENDTVVPESTDSGNDNNQADNNAADNTADNNVQDYGNVSMKNPRRGYSYLIVGSLPTPSAAEKQRQFLKSKGINADIIPAGQGKYRLSVGEFRSFQEATAYYNEFHSKHKMETWLWEY